MNAGKSIKQMAGAIGEASGEAKLIPTPGTFPLAFPLPGTSPAGTVQVTPHSLHAPGATVFFPVGRRHPARG